MDLVCLTRRRIKKNLILWTLINSPFKFFTENTVVVNVLTTINSTFSGQNKNSSIVSAWCRYYRWKYHMIRCNYYCGGLSETYSYVVLPEHGTEDDPAEHFDGLGTAGKLRGLNRISRVHDNVYASVGPIPTWQRRPCSLQTSENKTRRIPRSAGNLKYRRAFSLALLAATATAARNPWLTSWTRNDIRALSHSPVGHFASK